MANKTKKVTLINIFSSLLLQIAKIANGFIIPRLILGTFGSEVNGLVASLTQFLTYTSLIEGGVTGVVIAALYKPLTKKDDAKISSILATAKKFYDKISFVCIIYTVILAIVYPIFSNGSFDYWYIFCLTLILSISTIIQMKYALVLRTLLSADKKVYISSLTQTAVHILSIILAIVSIKIYPSIHLLKFLTGATFILQPIVFAHHINKNYKIVKNANEDSSLLKNRWDGFAINVANLIHVSTDVVVLTIFTNLTTVSVYSIYALVNTGIENAIGAIATSLNPSLGHAYARKNFKELNQKMDMYEYTIFTTIAVTMTAAVLLIVPFVMLYTKGINDADYYQPTFAILLVISEVLHLIKLPYLNMAYAANKFKEISPSAFIEAFINILLSVTLVPFFGIAGVAIGTIVAMTYRTIYHVWFTKKIITNRKQSIFYRKIFIYVATCLLAIIICHSIIPPVEYAITSWIWHAIVYCVIIGLLLFIMSYIFFRKELGYIKKYLLKH